MKDKMLKKTLFGIFIFALSLRLFAVFTQEESKKIPHSDASFYDNLAVSIASGHGFTYLADGGKRISTAYRTPGYPLFLAGIYTIFGHSYMAVKIIQAVLGAFLCVVIFYIVRLIYDDTIIGLLASLFTAIYKPFILGINFYGGPAYLLTEDLYMFMLALSILTVLLFIKKLDIKFGILSGICLGLSVLTRPEFILYPIILLFYLVWVSGELRKKLIGKYLIVYFFIGLTLIPWTVRNYVTFKKFIPLSTLGGYMFWSGNNPQANGGWAYAKNYSEIMEKTTKLSEYERNNIYIKEGIAGLKNDPKRIPRLFIKKILVHWAPFEEGFKIFNFWYAIVLLLGAIGLLFFRRYTITENVLLINFLTTTLIAVIIYGDPRYRYPYEFYLIIFAALAVNNFLPFHKFNFENFLSKGARSKKKNLLGVKNRAADR